MNKPEGEFKAWTDLHLGEQSRNRMLSARKVRGEEGKKKETVYLYLTGARTQGFTTGALN